MILQKKYFILKQVKRLKKYDEKNFDPDHDKKTSVTDLTQYMFKNRKTNVQIKKV